MLIRKIRDLRWKLADKYPALDHKGLYYRPPVIRHEVKRLRGIDAVLAVMAGIFMMSVGLAAIIFGCFVLWVIFSSIL